MVSRQRKWTTIETLLQNVEAPAGNEAHFVDRREEDGGPQYTWFSHADSTVSWTVRHALIRERHHKSLLGGSSKCFRSGSCCLETLQWGKSPEGPGRRNRPSVRVQGGRRTLVRPILEADGPSQMGLSARRWALITCFCWFVMESRFNAPFKCCPLMCTRECKRLGCRGDFERSRSCSVASFKKTPSGYHPDPSYQVLLLSLTKKLVCSNRVPPCRRPLRPLRWRAPGSPRWPFCNLDKDW